MHKALSSRYGVRLIQSSIDIRAEILATKAAERVDYKATREAIEGTSGTDPGNAIPVGLHLFYGRPCPSDANSLTPRHRVKLKPMELAYGIQAVFKDHLPRLQHGNDGLIFTGAEAPYTSGTDKRM